MISSNPARYGLLVILKTGYPVSCRISGLTNGYCCFCREKNCCKKSREMLCQRIKRCIRYALYGRIVMKSDNGYPVKPYWYLGENMFLLLPPPPPTFSREWEWTISSDSMHVCMQRVIGKHITYTANYTRIKVRRTRMVSLLVCFLRPASVRSSHEARFKVFNSAN